MIGYLRGLVLEKTPDALIVDVGGVGYEVVIPMSSLCALPPAGNYAALYIHTHVREDAIRLFGFVSYFDRKVFEALISVSSVGPKLAVTLLGPLTGVELCETVLEGRIAVLCSIPGVGAKTAERLLLELKPKFAKLMALRFELQGKAAMTGVNALGQGEEIAGETTLFATDAFADGRPSKATSAGAEKGLQSAKRLQIELEKKMAARRVLEDLKSALENVGYKEKQFAGVLRDYELKLGRGEEVVLESALRTALRKLSGHLVKETEADR